ncbi:MAG: methyltransferase family protein [Terriglobales bacterium]
MHRKPPTTWQKIARRIRVPVGFIFTALYLWLARPTWESIISGSLFVILGLAIRISASGHLRKNEELATGGPYAYTRNPLYLASLILALGFAIASRSWWVAALLVLIFAAIYMPVIQAEEVFLRTRFPGFADYAAAVPRILPKLTQYQHASGSFSWDLYFKHREYNSALGSAALIAALVGKLLWFLHRRAP